MVEVVWSEVVLAFEDSVAEAVAELVEELAEELAAVPELLHGWGGLGCSGWNCAGHSYGVRGSCDVRRSGLSAVGVAWADSSRVLCGFWGELRGIRRSRTDAFNLERALLRGLVRCRVLFKYWR